VKKLLVIGIIFLFIGISIAPSVTSIEFSNDKNSKDNELLEITLQLCRTDGVEEHNMFITHDQYEKLDRLIESFKADLNNAETREETIKIYNDMVVSLNEIGIFPNDTSCVEVQQLLKGENSVSNPEKMKSIKHFNTAYENLKNKNLGLDENENIFCLTAGVTTNTGIVGLGTIFGSLRLFIMAFIYEYLNPFFLGDLIDFIYFLRSEFWFFTTLFSFLLPLKLGGFMINGNILNVGVGVNSYNPSEGWVFTFGLNGIKTWDGPVYGNIFKIPIGPFEYYCGAIGFIGIKILPFGSGFYLGSALRVKLGSNPL
jgi:hypothetical protein